MEIRTARREDLPELLEIYNYEVINGVATFDLLPKSMEQWEMWFAAHNVENHPLIVAEIGGRVAGYASLSPYREKEAYKSTVELSIYVGSDFRRQGVATALMEAILSEAKNDDRTHTVVSVITSGNEASERLHKRFGFTFCGTMREVGVKFGTYLGIDNYTLCVHEEEAQQAPDPENR